MLFCSHYLFLRYSVHVYHPCYLVSYVYFKLETLCVVGGCWLKCLSGFSIIDKKLQVRQIYQHKTTEFASFCFAASYFNHSLTFCTHCSFRNLFFVHLTRVPFVIVAHTTLSLHSSVSPSDSLQFKAEGPIVNLPAGIQSVSKPGEYAIRFGSLFGQQVLVITGAGEPFLTNIVFIMSFSAVSYALSLSPKPCVGVCQSVC